LGGVYPVLAAGFEDELAILVVADEADAFEGELRAEAGEVDKDIERTAAVLVRLAEDGFARRDSGRSL
jgi:hypothetical protein